MIIQPSESCSSFGGKDAEFNAKIQTTHNVNTSDVFKNIVPKTCEFISSTVSIQDIDAEILKKKVMEELSSSQALEEKPKKWGYKGFIESIKTLKGKIETIMDSLYQEATIKNDSDFNIEIAEEKIDNLEKINKEYSQFKKNDDIITNLDLFYKEYKEMSDKFDVYFLNLQEKFQTEEEISISISLPPVSLRTHDYLCKRPDPNKLQKAWHFTKSMELLCEKISLEELIESSFEKVSYKAFSPETNLLYKQVELILSIVKDIVVPFDILKVKKFQDWYIQNKLEKLSYEIENFSEDTKSARKTEQLATIKKSTDEIATHYAVTKKQFDDLNKKGFKLYTMMSSFEENVVFNTDFKESYKSAWKEVQRVYDCMKRGMGGQGFVTSTWFNLEDYTGGYFTGRYTDPEVQLPSFIELNIVEAKIVPQESRSESPTKEKPQALIIEKDKQEEKKDPDSSSGSGSGGFFNFFGKK